MAVLLSYHGNEESNAALKAATAMTELTQTSLVILVATPMNADDERTEMDAQEKLWKALEHTSVPFQVRNAPANQSIAESVLGVAQEIEADLIVLGLRIGGSRVTTLGHNASNILLDAPCPVLTTTEYIFEQPHSHASTSSHRARR
ncbi:MAG: universal stress protein [Actinomycetaceae bacterium]|nr:universal stress protein [Actinomycetaceae bacterium]